MPFLRHDHDLFFALNFLAGYHIAIAFGGLDVNDPFGVWLWLNVQVLYIQRILLDKFAPWLDLLTHQQGKEMLGLNGVVYPHLQQGPPVRVHRRFP